MARRGRFVAAAEKGMTGAGKIPDVGTDNLMQSRAPLGPIGRIGKRGFKVSKKPKAAGK